MRPKVFFVKARKDEDLESIGEKTRWLLKSAGLKDIVSKGSLVALKLKKSFNK